MEKLREAVIPSIVRRVWTKPRDLLFAGRPHGPSLPYRTAETQDVTGYAVWSEACAIASCASGILAGEQDT
jgi:hypothetical protein